jgi:hypothetical protein
LRSGPGRWHSGAQCPRRRTGQSVFLDRFSCWFPDGCDRWCPMSESPSAGHPGQTRGGAGTLSAVDSLWGSAQGRQERLT